MPDFLQYWNEFNQQVSILAFLLNTLVTVLLTILLAMFYIRYGTTVSNRKRFAANFLPLGLTTMLTIIIVKSSIALSLGLVGALSIVRFRAAIKDPEELTFLFLVIAIGLATGANQPILAVVATFVLLLVLYLYKKLSSRQAFAETDKMYLNIETTEASVEQLNQQLKQIFKYVELKRLQTLPNPKRLEMSFLVQVNQVEQIEKAKILITGLSDNTTFSIISQPNI
jgi:uncharacterized membrane protein YhiD involved in acid resistance